MGSSSVGTMSRPTPTTIPSPSTQPKLSPPPLCRHHGIVDAWIPREHYSIFNRDDMALEHFNLDLVCRHSKIQFIANERTVQLVISRRHR